jgi:hypothetical protein
VVQDHSSRTIANGMSWRIKIFSLQTKNLSFFVLMPEDLKIARFYDGFIFLTVGAFHESLPSG